MGLMDASSKSIITCYVDTTHAGVNWVQQEFQYVNICTTTITAGMSSI